MITSGKTFIRSALVIAGLLAIVIWGPIGFGGSSAEARFGYENCHWNGTGPICRGSCPAGFVITKTSTSGCINGTKVWCCEPVNDRPGRFGYRNCYWDGSRPICRGQCARGFVERARDSGGCVSGHRAYCCEPFRTGK